MVKKPDEFVEEVGAILSAYNSRHCYKLARRWSGDMRIKDYDFARALLHVGRGMIQASERMEAARKGLPYDDEP